jgi:hypothetical protein
MARKSKGPGRHLGPFEMGDPESRKNSASIRRFFYDLVDEEFKGSLLDAAGALTRALNEAEDQRGYRRRGFSEHTAYYVERDRQMISFNELDSMGLYYGVPLALILLFTRMRSETQNHGSHRNTRAKQVLDAFQEALTALTGIVADMPPRARAYDYLDHKTFLAIRRVYLDHLVERQADLPLADPA